MRRFEVGDGVMAIVGGGGQAELAIVHERVAMPIPDELDWTAAGGVPEVFCTAHDALFTQAGLSVGERLLVHGAAGGVGMAAVQLGTMAGARVTATVRDEHCREQIATLGVRALAPDEFVEAGPFDVILELVGAPNFPANFEAIALCGRIGIVGIGGGAQTELNLGNLMYKRVRMFGTVMRARSLEEKALMTRGVETVRAARLRVRRPVGVRGGDVPARRRGRGVRALSGRRQARQDRARDVSQLVGVGHPVDRLDRAV